MPPKKRTYRRKRRVFKRKTNFRNKVRGAILSLAEKKRGLHNILNEEITHGGYRVFLTNIDQGAGEGNRIGRMIRVHAVVGNGEWREATGVADARSVCTMMLVQDTQTVGDAHAAISEIISEQGTTNAPFGLINVNNKGRFKILMRRQVTVGVRAADTGLRTFRFYYKFKKPFNVRYNGTLGTDIEANDLMLCFITGNDTSENGIYMSGVFRLWYSDL